MSNTTISSLTLLHQPAVVWHDFALGEVKSHLQGNQHRELQRNQLSSVNTETLLQLLHREKHKTGLKEYMLTMCSGSKNVKKMQMMVHTEILKC